MKLLVSKPSEDIKTFIKTVNEKVPSIFYDQNGFVEEMEMLAEIGRLTFQNERIRCCLCCSLLFYAPRVNSHSCSKRCNGNVRQMWHREESLQIVS